MTIDGCEANIHFSQLIECVARGERFIVTHHNAPIVMLKSVSPQPAAPLKQVIAQLKAFHQNYRLNGHSVQEMKRNYKI